VKAFSQIKSIISSVILLTFFYSPSSVAAVQCFSQAGTYGTLTVTETGSGCGTQLSYGGITGIWLGNTNVVENCQFDISPAVVGSTVEVRMTAHSVSYPSYSEEAVFSLNGSFVAVTPGDIDNSFPTGGLGLLAGTGGAGDPTVGGVSSSGNDGRGTVSFSAAPAAVSSINIQHNPIVDSPNGTIYEVCADDEGGVVEPDTAARFTVTKEFSDNNQAPVEVNLTCNTGLPLTQSFFINDNDAAPPISGSVTFVMTSFTDGAMDCTVTESPVNGYSPGYLASGDSQSDDDDSQNPGCNFISVSQGDQNACVITNSLHPKEAHVNKKWMLNGDANLIDPSYQLVLFCDGEILDGTPQGESGIWFRELYNGDSLGTADHYFQPDVYPNWDGGTECWVTERVYSSSVEPSNGCGTEAAPGLLVEIDGPEPSCIITNTVFFEGIPTLNQYGLAIMALLMLGVGFVGFRRFT
jgi:hypothetical protein